MKQNKIEILAPAGSVSRMKAAFSAGADACYIGGNKFGARAYAENPSEEELLHAIDYAHFHEKKLFLTVNTLLKEDELKKELFHYILPYYEAGLDAAIVQDLGVMSFLSREFPGLPLHASTQMTICDDTVMESLKKYPIERLVLSRELSLSEIEKFKSTGLEIECFVHGALCVCYSGQCSMSYFNGGRSGNRGSCAGPCRVDYDIGTSKKGEPLKGEKYLLSPKDSCSIDFIPEMAEAGIYSFKIEGRMKSPHYAALTSHLYRKWADFYLNFGKEAFHEDKAKKERAEDIKRLSDLYNRGSFTSAYLFSHNGKDMMADRRPNHNGVLVGRVKRVGSAKKKNVVTILLSENVGAQDVLEIRDVTDATPVYEFTLKEGQKRGSELSSNFIMGLKLKTGMEVYRTKNASLLSHITENFIERPLKRRLTARLEARLGRELTLSLFSENTSLVLFGDIVTEAKTKPVLEGRFKEALLKLGDSEFFTTEEEIEVKTEGNIFYPMSSLNELRRRGLKELTEEILAPYKRPRPLLCEENVEANVSPSHRSFMFLLTKLELLNPLLLSIGKKEDIEVCFSLDFIKRSALLSAALRVKEEGYPVFLRLPMIFRAEYRKRFEAFFFSEKGREVLSLVKGFVIRNLESLSFVRTLEEKLALKFTIISDSGVHVFNSEAAKVLSELGINSYTMSLEQSPKEGEAVRSKLTHPISMSFIAYGREELMITAQCQWKNKGACVKEMSSSKERLPEELYLQGKKKGKDGKTSGFWVLKNCESCHNYILMEEPLNFLTEPSVIKSLKPDRLRFDFTLETEKEIREVIKLAKLDQ